MIIVLLMIDTIQRYLPHMVVFLSVVQEAIAMDNGNTHGVQRDCIDLQSNSDANKWGRTETMTRSKQSDCERESRTVGESGRDAKQECPFVKLDVCIDCPLQVNLLF